MATPLNAEKVIEMITAADDDDVLEQLDLGSDDELEFNNYDD